jgi:protein SCO1/2
VRAPGWLGNAKATLADFMACFMSFKNVSSLVSRNWAALAASVLIAGAVLFSCFAPVAAGGSGALHFPNIELVTQDGKRVHFYDDLIKGKIVAIDLIYTTCEYACPLETARLVQVQKKLGGRVGSDIFFYSISIDPQHDTPEVLRAYMQKFHVAPGWTFLTGSKQDIDLLSRRLGLYSDPSVNKDGHLPHILIGNEATGQWMRGSALDNPSFQARMIGDFLDNFKHASLVAPQNAADGRPLENFDQGQYLFGRQCIACHTIGHGESIGPDLLGVTHRRSQEWLLRMIQRPDEMLDQKDPIATALLAKYNGVRMPNISVGDLDAKYMLSYIEAQTAANDEKGRDENKAPGRANRRHPL